MIDLHTRYIIPKGTPIVLYAADVDEFAPGKIKTITTHDFYVDSTSAHVEFDLRMERMYYTFSDRPLPRFQERPIITFSVDTLALRGVK